MTISINGEKVETRDARTIAELVERYHFSAESILIEHNGVALHPREWSQQKISDGDRIELIQAVAGG